VVEAQRLVETEGVDVILGAAASAITLAVAETVTIPNEILQISPASTSPALTDVEDGDFLFRMPISDAAQGVVLAQLIAEDLGLTSVCDLFVNNAYGQGLSAQYRETFEALGGTVTASVPHDDGEAVSYSAELNQCVEGNPEALVAISYPWGQAEVYLREALEGDLIDNFVFVDGTKQPQMFAELGWDAFGGMRGTAPSSLDVVAGEVFDAAYVAEYGQPTTVPFVREMYDSVYLVALAAEKAGSTDSVAIRDALRDTANPPGEAVGPGAVGLAAAFELISMGQDINYEGASGPADLDENGDAPVGAVETWQVDCATETLLTRSISRVNVATGEVTLEQETTPPTPLTGDVNGDSMINSIDAAVVLQYSAGLITSLCRENADVDGDGTINSIDAALILQYEAGLLSSLAPS
jgi:ABC-type branched-subunit amino acid transport system substrate-binding protein